MAEDTKAMDNGILDEREFLDLAKIILDERIKMLRYELGRFRNGFMFFYISTVDLSSHMFFDRKVNPSEPGDGSGEVIRMLYKKMDALLGEIKGYLDDEDTLIVMSDHGFSEFSRQVNVNSWLVEEGYESLLDTWNPEDEFYSSVDWSSTRAYALGLNGLYVNLRGREKFGVVEPGSEYRKLVDEIAAKLEKFRDPKNGRRIVKKAYKKYETYRGKYTAMSPDIVIGFASGYRSSDESALGQFSKEVLSDNKRSWMADHCMDYREVPGILLSNRKIKYVSPALYDLAPTILREFGIDPDDEMIGRALFLFND
jgi:predicted AlkP superfamily phosphohydrolase/phosphomutase